MEALSYCGGTIALIKRNQSVSGNLKSMSWIDFPKRGPCKSGERAKCYLAAFEVESGLGVPHCVHHAHIGPPVQSDAVTLPIEEKLESVRLGLKSAHKLAAADNLLLQGLSQKSLPHYLFDIG